MLKSCNVFKDFSEEKNVREFWYQIWLKFLKSPLSFIDLKIIAGKLGLLPIKARGLLLFEYSYLEKDCRKKSVHATIPKGNMGSDTIK